MLIFPAIDLLDGRCVRLRQGRFDEATVHSDDPVAVAQFFVDEGAEALHIVDLDGARLGEAKNLEWIYRIRQAVRVPLQVGGGVRSHSVASRLLEAGIDRIIFGTAAAEDPKLLHIILKDLNPDQVGAALDLREGQLVVQGREMESSRGLDKVLGNLKTLGIDWVVCTDVTRDGILIGPSDEFARALVTRGFSVVVGGGVATVADVVSVRNTGAAGCVIGSAFYGGLLTVRDAKEAARPL
jgi:phosphoribosylformimino-5-aminoimidazole carboxamide ribotide isomerase